MIKKFIFIIILLVSIESHAKLSVYAGLGKNFSGLGAARLGVDKHVQVEVQNFIPCEFFPLTGPLLLTEICEANFVSIFTAS